MSLLVSMLLVTGHNCFIVTLFNGFFPQGSAPGEDIETHGRQRLAALLTDQGRQCGDWRRGTSFDSGGSLVFIECSHFVQYNVFS